MKLDIRIDEKELEDFEVRDGEELEKIRNIMKRAKRVEFKRVKLERGELEEVGEGLYLGLDGEGNLIIAVEEEQENP